MMGPGGSVFYCGVIGPSQAPPAVASDVERTAFAVGALLAAAGAVLVCGGGGGAMAAACRGAKSAGGTTLGILPGLSRAEANPYVDIAVATGLGELRNGVIVRAVDALIAVGGGVGTLSEIGLALKAGKPVVGLGTWEVSPPPGGGGPGAGILRATTPAQAVAMAMAAWGGPAGGGGNA